MAIDTNEDAFSREELERGHHLFAQECLFVAGATGEDNIPPGVLPEVAFAGRSNVGKSSLINALTGRKTLARVSHTPGRTKQINLFSLGNRLMLADLPGHGYARASKGDIANWTTFTKDYLKGRVTLKRLCFLIDSRHGLKDIDRELMRELDTAAVSYQVVLTKSDKMKKEDREKFLTKLSVELKTHGAAHPEILLTSSREGTGIAELRATLAALAENG